MPTNDREYHRRYVRERKVECYPKERELQAIRNMQIQKGMSQSQVAAYLIGEGIKRVMESKNNY